MTRKKPTVIRYYKTRWTNQYCEVSGYIGAVNETEKFFKRKKIIIDRVSKREHDANRVRIGETVKSLSLVYKWHPPQNRKKELRMAKYDLNKRNAMGLHELVYSHDRILYR